MMDFHGGQLDFHGHASAIGSFVGSRLSSLPVLLGSITSHNRDTKLANSILVGGLEHEIYFSIQLGIIIPTDFHIFQRGRLTTNQYRWDRTVVFFMAQKWGGGILSPRTVDWTANTAKLGIC